MLDQQDATNRDAKGLPFTVSSVHISYLVPAGLRVLRRVGIITSGLVSNYKTQTFAYCFYLLDSYRVHHRPEESDSSDHRLPRVYWAQLR